MRSKTVHIYGWWTQTQTTMSHGTTPTWVARGHSTVTRPPLSTTVSPVWVASRFRRRETNFTDDVLSHSQPTRGGGHKMKHQGNSNHGGNFNRNNTNKPRYGPGGNSTTLANNTTINAASSRLPLPVPYDGKLIHTVAIYESVVVMHVDTCSPTNSSSPLMYT